MGCLKANCSTTDNAVCSLTCKGVLNAFFPSDESLGFCAQVIIWVSKQRSILDDLRFMCCSVRWWLKISFLFPLSFSLPSSASSLFPLTYSCCLLRSLSSFHSSPSQDGVGCWEDAHQLVHLPALQVPQGKTVSQTQTHTCRCKTLEAILIQLVFDKCLTNTHTSTAAELDKVEAAGYISLTFAFYEVNSPLAELRNLQSLKHCSDTAGHVVEIAIACHTNVSFLFVSLSGSF